MTETAANGARFTAQTTTVRDEVNGIDEKPLRFGRKNISLVLENELTPQMITLPVARILRSGAGRFIFDPSFIPPVLEISSSPRLMTLDPAADRDPRRQERYAGPQPRREYAARPAMRLERLPASGFCTP